MKIRRMTIAALLVLIAVFVLGWKTWKNVAHKAQQNDGMQLIVNDLPQHGVIIHDASHPAFKNELSAFYKIPPELLDDMTRYSVVVRNNTRQYVVRLTLIWRFYPSQGPPITKTHSHAFGRQMFNNAAEGLVRPNGQYAMTLLLPGAGFSRDPVQEVKNDDKLNGELTGLNSLIARSVKWSVDVDGVLFSNGVYVGPDSAKYFDYVKAEYGGARDLIQELVNKINGNQPYASIFAHAQSYASITDKELEAQFPDFRTRMTDPVYTYNRFKNNMGRQVIARRDRYGEQAAIDFIIQNSKFHIPLVKR